MLLIFHSSLSPVPRLKLEEGRPQSRPAVGILRDCPHCDPLFVSLRGKPYQCSCLSFVFFELSSCSEAQGRLLCVAIQACPLYLTCFLLMQEGALQGVKAW